MGFVKINMISYNRYARNILRYCIFDICLLLTLIDNLIIIDIYGEVPSDKPNTTIVFFIIELILIIIFLVMRTINYLYAYKYGDLSTINSGIWIVVNFIFCLMKGLIMVPSFFLILDNKLKIIRPPLYIIFIKYLLYMFPIAVIFLLVIFIYYIFQNLCSKNLVYEQIKSLVVTNYQADLEKNNTCMSQLITDNSGQRYDMVPMSNKICHFCNSNISQGIKYINFTCGSCSHIICYLEAQYGKTPTIVKCGNIKCKRNVSCGN